MSNHRRLLDPVPLTGSIERATRDALDREATALGYSRGDLVRRILAAHVEQQKAHEGGGE